MQISERIQVRLGQIIHSKYFQLKNVAKQSHFNADPGENLFGLV